MKLTNTRLMKKNSGMTLIELTVVIIVLLALIAVLFVGAKAYINGSNKTACIMNQRNLQQGARAFFNMSPTATTVAMTDLVGAEKFVAVTPKCPSTKTDFTLANTARDTALGTLFAPCPSIATWADHVPDSKDGW